MNPETLQIGKLYRPDISRDLLAIDEQQYKSNLISCIYRSEKLYSQANTFKGTFNMYVVKPNTVMLLLESKKDFFGGDIFYILKFLIEDKMLYIPISEKRISMGYIFLLEEV